MSLKKIDEIKNSKWFSIWDLVAFGVIIIIAVVLILSFTIGRDKSALGGFSVSYRGESIYEYDFDSDKILKINEKYIKIDGDRLRFDDGNGGYNIIYVNTAAKTVDVTDSNCSSHKDCVHTAKLTNNSSAPIICTVHGLTVSPLKFVDDGNIII